MFAIRELFKSEVCNKNWVTLSQLTIMMTSIWIPFTPPLG